MKYEEIIRDLKNKVYHPIYLLFGEEEFFIDQISDYIEEHVLEEAEKEFNQAVLYGMETDVQTLVAQAKRFPMMASYNVIIVKEAQNLKNMDQLLEYSKQPSPTTILVLNYKHKKPDGRMGFVKQMKKQGVFFHSKALYPNQVPAWVESYLKSKKFSINPRACQILVESLGAELSKISNELDKLILTLSEPKEINAQDIERNIGISKDYNVFELNSALGSRDVVKANKIITYFAKNGKDHPPARVLPMVYSYFSKLLLYHTVASKDRKAIAATLGISPFFIKDYAVGASNFSIKKIARVISALRKADTHSKGIGGGELSEADIFKELVYEILH
ncbi:MAG: DNA polymerase III subunit delta [Vicingaceae bacterium]